MKKIDILSTLVLWCFCTLSLQAQSRWGVGAYTGMGRHIPGSSGGANNAQFNHVVGITTDYRLWRGLHLSGRMDYQSRIYRVKAHAQAFNDGQPKAQKDHLVYQLGANWHFKRLYFGVGTFYSDNLNAPEYLPLIPDCYSNGSGTPHEYYYNDVLETFSYWGMNATLGAQQPITPKVRLFVEAQFHTETGIVQSYYADSFHTVGLRLGLLSGF